MTLEERQESLSKEIRELMEWEELESKKIIEKLESEGKALGLDGYPEEFAYIRETRNRRWREILEKYKDLPPNTKLKLW